MKQLCALLLGLAMSGTPNVAMAADVTAVDSPNCNLRLQGNIEAGDAKKLDALLGVERDPSIYNNICLDSADGSFAEALAIVEVMAKYEPLDRHSGTIVEAGARCIGPCAMVFMAGRYHAHHGATFPLRKLHPEGELVFRIVSPNTAFEQDKRAVAEAFSTAVRDIARMLRLNTGAQMLDGSVKEHNKRYPRALVADLLRLAVGQTLPVDRVDQLFRWNITAVGLPHPRTITGEMLKRVCEAYSDVDRVGTYGDYAVPKLVSAIPPGAPITRIVVPPASSVKPDDREACIVDVVQHPKAGPVISLLLVDNPTPAKIKSEAMSLERSRQFMTEENGGDGGFHGLIGEGLWLLYPKETRIRDLQGLMRQ